MVSGYMATVKKAILSSLLAIYPNNLVHAIGLANRNGLNSSNAVLTDSNS